MAPTKEVHFRLRQSTVDKLRALLDRSAHRSLNALADEMLDTEATWRLTVADRQAEKDAHAKQ